MIDTFSFSQNFYHELWGFSDSHDWAASLLSVWYWFSFVWLKCILFIKFLPIRQSIFNSDSMIYALGIGVLFKDSLKIDTQTHTVTSWAPVGAINDVLHLKYLFLSGLNPTNCLSDWCISAAPPLFWISEPRVDSTVEPFLSQLYWGESQITPLWNLDIVKVVASNCNALSFQVSSGSSLVGI